jgi:hypothetical protein
LTGSTKRIADNYLSVKEEDEQEQESHSKTASGGLRKRSLPVSTPNFRIGGVSIVVVKQGPLHRCVTFAMGTFGIKTFETIVEKFLIREQTDFLLV